MQSRNIIEYCTLQQLDCFRKLAHRFATNPFSVSERQRKALRGMLFIECANGGAPWEYPRISQLSSQS
jgi:hypothetical protein